ncbi:hypothetical protein [Dietzia cinnamea]|nr:hypothetical protein [Dietzia cinnamea]
MSRSDASAHDPALEISASALEELGPLDVGPPGRRPRGVEPRQ